jgi:hypothetical protein
MIPPPVGLPAETLCEVSAVPTDHRIDSAHPAPPISLASTQPGPPPCAAQLPSYLSAHQAFGQRAGQPAPMLLPTAVADSAPDLDCGALRIAHGEDLLIYLQRLSDDLDARSAQLQADIAMHERRERAFRLWAQQRSAEVRDQQEACDQQQRQLQAQARRLAMTDGEGYRFG